MKAVVPWFILSLLVFLWGLPSIKLRLDKISIFKIPVSGLHNLILRVALRLCARLLAPILQGALPPAVVSDDIPRNSEFRIRNFQLEVGTSWSSNNHHIMMIR